MKLAAMVLAVLAVLSGGVAVVLVSALGDEDEPVVYVAGGDPGRGADAIDAYGCTSCHQIPGLDEPEARVGPPLAGMAERRYIAGDEPNTVDVMIRWLQDPQAIEPGTLMPDLGVTEQEARDIAAYLYTLR
jgi:cytochrome c